ncbi:MAG: hypothetical protein OIF32_11490, partial [Campylobacterales bacterium]|nr:hypothetical protein [Campylobacterales bacterium]
KKIIGFSIEFTFHDSYNTEEELQVIKGEIFNKTLELLFKDTEGVDKDEEQVIKKDLISKLEKERAGEKALNQQEKGYFQELFIVAIEDLIKDDKLKLLDKAV